MNVTKLRRVLRVVMAGLGVLLLGLLLWRRQAGRLSQAAPGGMAAYGVVPDFKLTDQEGRPFGLADLKGKVWLADFIFTRCGGPCPLLTQKMAALQKEFSAAPGVRFVSFTVDPVNDTPAVMKKYAARFKADVSQWVFLTGPEDDIQRLVKEGFRLVRERNKAAQDPGQSVLHTLHFVLVGADGLVKGLYTPADQVELEKLRLQIRQELQHSRV